MTSELEKIDLLRARLGVSYKEAKEALNLADGDVVQALIKLEEKNRHWNEKLHGKGNEFMGQFKTLLEKGQRTKVKIKKDDDTVVEFPATVGALGVLGAMASTPILVVGALGTIAGLVNNYRLEFQEDSDRWEPEVEVPENNFDKNNPQH
ncbi:conserved hypothetical protein [Desulforamulus reducens MI-1]|uniref:DUF4342 domain-containing protein n=1 Tax=Desulforamulus reducens (strain ATCC BAA-1160 / DSM 100696 / MI-1) TaxID=349161 RepID=A4J7D1_DESRM|nr:DUF4342 domain-containing protein [Desulforamulus reducens]ABO50984.1 conserved hypothetical protein [Desulforamulus reducens MI-1]